ncbi:hypothetical protein PG996_008307 [Apiospora saccharicola]|uniref:Uncharacterized protein n=1 Tax=Apiospora saccharicola TaxID=335842 RepID=A0ABR1UXN8_9PEZI
MRFTTFSAQLVTFGLVCAAPSYIDNGIHSDNGPADVKARTYVDKGIQNDAPGMTRVFRRRAVTIYDLGIRSIPKIDQDDESAKNGVEKRLTTDGISTCGSNWMPIIDNFKDLRGMGYDSAVQDYCYHVTHSYDNKATIIGPQMYHSAYVQDGYVLKGNIPASVDFEIHNKMTDATHEVNEDNCKTYLRKMSEDGSKCFGKNNIDTKGGTYQVGAEKISYHGLPKAKVA